MEVFLQGGKVTSGQMDGGQGIGWLWIGSFFRTLQKKWSAGQWLNVDEKWKKNLK
jgi:hypothetical protein